MTRALLVGLVCLLAAGSAGAQNLAPNPDFDSGLQGWISSGGGFTFDSLVGAPAPSALGHAMDSMGAGLSSACLPIDTSQRYRFETLCQIPVGQPGKCGIAFSLWEAAGCVGSSATNLADSVGLAGLWVTPRTVFATHVARSLKIHLLAIPAPPFSGPLEPNFDAVRLDRLTKGDFNRDDQTDLLLRNGSSLMVWKMNGTELAAEEAVSPGLPSFPGWSVATTDDFNQDGATDLVVRNALLGQTAIWYMEGAERTGTLSMSYALDPPWQIVASADFDRNGYPDLVWRNTSTQKLLIWKLQAAQPIGDIIPAPDQAAHSNWTLVAALDFNLDGHVDFLWYNTTTGKIAFWFMDQNVARISGQFANPDSAGNANWRVVAAGEYGDSGAPPNGPDIVWRNATSGKLVVWLMDTSGNRKAGVFTTPDAPTPALAWNVVGPR